MQHESIYRELCCCIVTGSYYVALDGPELATEIRLALNPLISACLSLPTARLKRQKPLADNRVFMDKYNLLTAHMERKKNAVWGELLVNSVITHCT